MANARQPLPTEASRLRRFFRTCGAIFAYVAVLLLALWTIAALYFDVRIAWLRFPCIALYFLVMAAVLAYANGFRWRVYGWVLCSLIVTLWAGAVAVLSFSKSIR